MKTALKYNVLLKFQILKKIRFLWVQMRRRQGAYRYIDCTARDSLGTNFLEACAPSKQTPPFLTLSPGIDFLKFKEPGPFKLTYKISAIICEVTQFEWYWCRPPYFSPYNTFNQISKSIESLFVRALEEELSVHRNCDIIKRDCS